jgi:aminoglycoside 3-N-acetyltransferase
MPLVTPLPLTPNQIHADFCKIGVAAGQTIMLHASVKAVGPVMGGPNTILQALLDHLTPEGTLLMYAGWEDIPDYLAELPSEAQAVYRAEFPPFDPVTARAVRGYGILVECLRTWPDVQRSLNPEVSMVAVGGRAIWLTRDHPLNYGYGAGSPFAKLVEVQGKVLLIGSPLDNITLLHYAENRARLRQKRVIHYSCPILRDGIKVWVEIEDFNTSEPHADYTFETIARDYLNAGNGTVGRIGQAESYLFDAANLANFAVAWLESRFGA